jgi:hypothetical protein
LDIATPTQERHIIMEYVYHDSEDHFSDTTACISGIATVRIEFEEDYSADIGGTDGHVCVATLTNLQVGTKSFTADEIAEMFGAAVVSRFESWVAEYEGTK